MTIKPSTLANKISKLEKHLVKHPEDIQTKEYLSNLKSDKLQASARKKSENKNGWVSKNLATSKNPLTSEYLNLNKRTQELKDLAQMLRQVMKFKNEDSYTKKQGKTNEKQSKKNK